MKKVLFTIYDIITLACMAYGIPLTIVNIGKEYFFIYLAIGITGIVLFLIGIFLLTLEKKKNKQQ
ncbi:MAG: hypothetical protein K6C32_00725 [Bacilli bacterium]|nr:hypothetical protein [Bacilli bacterium]